MSCKGDVGYMDTTWQPVSPDVALTPRVDILETVMVLMCLLHPCSCVWVCGGRVVDLYLGYKGHVQNVEKDLETLGRFFHMCWVSVLCKRFHSFTGCIQILAAGNCWWWLRGSPHQAATRGESWKTRVAVLSSGYTLSSIQELNYYVVIVMDKHDSPTQNINCWPSTYGNIAKCHHVGPNLAWP